MEQKKNRNMIFIAIANLFLVFVGVGLVIPVMPSIKADMGLSGTAMGYLFAAFSLAQLIVSPIAGRISDRLGRKPMIVWGMMLYGISEFIFGFGTTLNVLFLSRVLGGVAAAMIMPSIMAFVADVSSIEERPKVMGWVSAAISGGFVVGPGLGGLLGNINIRLPFNVAGVLGIVGFLFALAFLTEPEKYEAHNETNEKTKVMDVLKKKEFILPFIIILISSFGLAAFESIYSLFIDLTLHFSVSDIAMVITVSGTLALLVQVFLFEKIIRRIGEVQLIRICFLVSAIFVWVMTHYHSAIMVVLATFVIFLGFDLIRPAITTYISKRAGSNQGVMNGMNSSLTSVGNIVGPVLSGALLDIDYQYPYLVVFGILTLTFILTLFWRKDHVGLQIEKV